MGTPETLIGTANHRQLLTREKAPRREFGKRSRPTAEVGIILSGWGHV
jgi:hypothetical protein